MCHTNYWPISLLSTISKVYAPFLHSKLLSWIKSEAIIYPEQAGFRRGVSALDHCLIIYHLADKFSSCSGGCLYVAFMDLRAAFIQPLNPVSGLKWLKNNRQKSSLADF